jgi:phosphate transport system substrate-binding protein
MNKKSKYFTAVSLILIIMVSSCKQKEEITDTITTGTTSIIVDETIKPIIEDQIAVFENSYDAKINLIAKSEKEAINDLTDKKADIVVLSRKLNAEENLFFKQKKIMPKSTLFATDAIALIKSNKSNDSLIALIDIVDFLKGKKNNIKGLVFDNPNSSTVRLICEKAQIKSIPENLFFSFKTNEEVVKYVSENNGFIGIIGINWLMQPTQKIEEQLDNINILSVKPFNGNEYVFPSQDLIAQGKYPLARDLYIINCQGYEGLGMGFSSFIAGERGQRIILKSGLVPVRFPSRNLIINK